MEFLIAAALLDWLRALLFATLIRFRSPLRLKPSPNNPIGLGRAISIERNLLVADLKLKVSV
ncbi:hypothetical protein ACFRAQ_32785 [Nocardia sp. NPDC056611]|uniref:hypothetical protein n=1 Tax=Nocardia sp. NPDC056611 TaxID=3345877 RepID=UPI00366FB0AD